MEYYNALEKAYRIFYDLRSGDTSKIEFLSSDVFDFTTYDSQVDTIFGKAMLDVLDAIVTQTSREYQTDYKKYLNFLMMVNTPFLKVDTPRSKETGILCSSSLLVSTDFHQLK